MLSSECGKQFSLARDVIVHGDNDRRLHLFDHFDNIFETKIRHGVDGNHQHINSLQNLFLFGAQKVTDISQVRETQTPHFKNENGICNRAPALTTLAGNVDDRDVLDRGSDGIPSLFERDAAQNDRIARYSPGVVVGKVIITHGHRVSLNPGSDVKVGIGNDLSFASRVNEETRMTVPLHKEGTERGALDAT